MGCWGAGRKGRCPQHRSAELRADLGGPCRAPPLLHLPGRPSQVMEAGAVLGEAGPTDVCGACVHLCVSLTPDPRCRAAPGLRPFCCRSWPNANSGGSNPIVEALSQRAAERLRSPDRGVASPPPPSAAFI